MSSVHMRYIHFRLYLLVSMSAIEIHVVWVERDGGQGAACGMEVGGPVWQRAPGDSMEAGRHNGRLAWNRFGHHPLHPQSDECGS